MRACVRSAARPTTRRWRRPSLRVCRTAPLPIRCFSPTARCNAAGGSRPPAPFVKAEAHAETHRHPEHHDHRRGADCHRSGLRVRLFRRAGVQGAPLRGLSRHPRELEPGNDHDRSRARGRDLCRADHARDRREDHRAREAGRAAADDGRPDRAEHGDGARRQRRAGAARRRADRREGRRDRPRRGPAQVPRRDERDRHRKPEERDCAFHAGGARGARRRRPSGGDPPVLHARRHGRRHRLQPRRNSNISWRAASKPRPPPKC